MHSNNAELLCKMNIFFDESISKTQTNKANNYQCEYASEDESATAKRHSTRLCPGMLHVASHATVPWFAHQPWHSRPSPGKCPQTSHSRPCPGMLTKRGIPNHALGCSPNEAFQKMPWYAHQTRNSEPCPSMFTKRDIPDYSLVFPSDEAFQTMPWHAHQTRHSGPFPGISTRRGIPDHALVCASNDASRPRLRLV